MCKCWLLRLVYITVWICGMKRLGFSFSLTSLSSPAVFRIYYVSLSERNLLCSEYTMFHCLNGTCCVQNILWFTVWTEPAVFRIYYGSLSEQNLLCSEYTMVHCLNGTCCVQNILWFTVWTEPAVFRRYYGSVYAQRWPKISFKALVKQDSRLNRIPG